MPVQVFFMGDTLRAQGEFEIRQSDFGIKSIRHQTYNCSTHITSCCFRKKTIS